MTLKRGVRGKLWLFVTYWINPYPQHLRLGRLEELYFSSPLPSFTRLWVCRPPLALGTGNLLFLRGSRRPFTIPHSSLSMPPEGTMELARQMLDQFGEEPWESLQ